MPYHDNEYIPDSPEKTTGEKEGLIAPPGFHYTPDGTLEKISIKELNEKISGILGEVSPVLNSKRSAFLKTNDKKRLSSVGRNRCAIFTPGNAAGQGLTGIHYYPDVSAMSSPPVAMPIPAPPVSWWGPNDNMIYGPWELASYDNKIWLAIKYRVGHGSPLPGSGTQQGFLELDFDLTTLSVSFSRIIPLHTQNPDIDLFGGGTSIDANTIVFSRKFVSGAVPELVKYDISGPTAIETILFTTPLDRTIVDSQYIPSYDTYVVVAADFTVNPALKFICHYTSTGSLIACSAPDILWHMGIWCYNSSVYVVKSGSLYTVDLATMSTSPAGSFSGAAGDASSNPECCGVIIPPPPPPPPILTPCYEIGDIGPAGGLIFATPYAGLNNTKYFYEVGLDDINEPEWTSTDPSIWNKKCEGSLRDPRSNFTEFTGFVKNMPGVPINSFTIPQPHSLQLGMNIQDQPPPPTGFIPTGTTITNIIPNSPVKGTDTIVLSQFFDPYPNISLNFHAWSGSGTTIQYAPTLGSEFGMHVDKFPSYPSNPSFNSPIPYTTVTFGQGYDNTKTIHY